MPLPPVLLSEIILQHPEVTSFGEFLGVVGLHAEEVGRIFMEVDLKPEFTDTPRNWQSKVEAAFVWGGNGD